MEISYWHTFYVLVGAILVNLLTQIATIRMPPGRPLVLSSVIGFGVGFLTVIVAHCFIQPFDWAVSTVGAALYLAGGYCYFHLINIGEASIRLRVLRELSHSPDGLTLELILSHYDARRIIEARIQRLLSSGQIVERDGRFFEFRPRLIYFAKIFQFLKWFILGSVDPLARSQINTK